MPQRHFEPDHDNRFPGAVRVEGHPDVAWNVLGWEIAPDQDTEWSGYEVRTGWLVCTMVGDDHEWLFEREEVSALERADYCGVCGQIGCSHDGLDRSDAAD
jgi:hypothetical protein